MTEAPLDVYRSYDAPAAPPNEKQETMLAAERMDEQQIVESMKGRMIEKLFHEIEQRRPDGVIIKIPVLAWAGVKYFALQLGHMTVEKVELNETEDKYRATAWAYDKKRDIRVMGAAEQSKMMKLRDGSKIPDEFALAKVVSKSQRNALKALIPETLISEAFQQWKNRKPST